MNAPGPAMLLAGDMLHAALARHLSNFALVHLTGCSAFTISRTVSGACGIDPQSKKGQLTLS